MNSAVKNIIYNSASCPHAATPAAQKLIHDGVVGLQQHFVSDFSTEIVLTWGQNLYTFECSTNQIFTQFPRLLRLRDTRAVFLRQLKTHLLDVLVGARKNTKLFFRESL